VWPHPETIKEVRMNSDHADEAVVAVPDPLGEFTALAIDPENSDWLTAATLAGLNRASNSGSGCGK
jgi:hypothetical protein